MSSGGFDFDLDLEEDVEIEIEEPKMYKVIIHNDDVTTFDFVIDILVKIFDKSLKDAENITMNIHNNGSGVAGVYIYEIARTKIRQVHDLARKENFPLKCTMEEDI